MVGSFGGVRAACRLGIVVLGRFESGGLGLVWGEMRKKFKICTVYREGGKNNICGSWWERVL